jgi:hypothetical protein
VGSRVDVPAVERVTGYRDLGVDALQIQPVKNDRETTERFVDEVMPEFAQARFDQGRWSC